MSSIRCMCVAVALLSLTGVTYGQESASAGISQADEGVPMAHLIALVAKKSGKKFVVDPRVRGNVTLLGQDPTNVNFSELQSILSVYNFMTAESGGYVFILPDSNARQVPMPRLSGKETFPDAQIVETTITVKNVPAAQLVPLLRPLIPQYGHLAALPCVNKLMLVDRYGNVRRLEAMIESLDVGTPFTPEKCAYHDSLATPPGPANAPLAPREPNVERR